MTAEEIVDGLIETCPDDVGQVLSGVSEDYYKKRKAEAAIQADPEAHEMDQFYRGYLGGIGSGKKIEAPARLAAYTYPWPEFDRWSGQTGDDLAPAELRRFYKTPELWTSDTMEGDVEYKSKPFRVQGQGSMTWKVKWARAYYTEWKCVASVEIEHWDRASSRIWKSHKVQPVMWDYRKTRNALQPGEVIPGLTQAHWDAADPAHFDTKPLDKSARDRMVADAKQFLAKLGKVARIDRVEWDIAGVTEAMVPSTNGFEQIGGDWGDAWAYGGTWFNPTTGDLVHFPGVEGEDVESDSPKIDKMLGDSHYRLIAGELTLEDTEQWIRQEDTTRQALAEQYNAEKEHTYYRTSVEKDATIESDWAREIAEIKQEQELTPEQWAEVSPASKMDDIAGRIGWDEFDHYPDKISRKDLGTLLGVAKL